MSLEPYNENLAGGESGRRDWLGESSGGARGGEARAGVMSRRCCCSARSFLQ